MPDSIVSKNEVTDRRTILRADAPHEAESYRAMRRQVDDGGSTDLHARYISAAEHVRAMPRYSTVRGERLAPANDVASISRSILSSWDFLGPGNVGGRTRTILVDPRDPDVLYAGGVSGGVWKSTSGGERWFPVGDLLPNLAVNAMVFAPDDPDTIYLGTGEGYFREEVRFTGLPLRGAGIFVSRDGGATWARLDRTGGEDFHYVNDILFSVHDPNRLYAATRTGVWRSGDGGESWTRVLDPLVKGGCLDLAVRPDQPGDWLLAACGTLADGAIWHRKDAERPGAWSEALSEPGMGRVSLAVAPSSPNVVYALAASSVKREEEDVAGGLHAIFRSDGGGAAGTWRAMVRRDDPNPIHANFLSNLIVNVQQQCFDEGKNRSIAMGWYVNTIAVDPVDAERVFAGGVDLFRSDDGGSTWGPVSYWWTGLSQPSRMHADLHTIVFHPSWDGAAKQTMLLGNDGGVARTDNARAPIGFSFNAVCNPEASSVAFRSLNSGFGITQFYHGAVAPDGSFVIGGTQDNGTQLGFVDRPDEWVHILGGDGGYCAIDPSDPAVIIAESQGAAISRSLDGGRTFESARRGLDDQFMFIAPVVMDPSEPSRLWTGGRKMWRSVNQASSWSPASEKLDGYVNSIAISPADSDYVLAGMHHGTIHRTTRARTSGSLTTWPSSRPRSGFVTSVAFDPYDVTVAYATYGGFGGAHVWASQDGGATWTPIDGNGEGRLPDIPVHVHVNDPAYPSRLYVGTDLGVFVSLDRGASWSAESDLPRAVTEWLVLQNDPDPPLYAFTHGRGVWRATLQPSGRQRPVHR
jgi:photosystem II stability/assembly factor-like uncharacterized protein